jgi:outer membrane protein OmpA-like peptidoglycan-associated protein
VRRRISETLRFVIGGLVLAAGLSVGFDAQANEPASNFNPAIVVGPDGRPVQTGRIEWGLWIDPDGCMHWWADGGLEGYMVPRRDPKTGRAVCLKKNTCAVENTDVLFHTDSSRLTAHGRQRLEQFFRSAGAFGYAIYGHTDSRASDEYNMNLSQRRARAVASVAGSVGASVDRVEWYGERMPRASNATAEGMRQNRRVEIVCYRW